MMRMKMNALAAVAMALGACGGGDGGGGGGNGNDGGTSGIDAAPGPGACTSTVQCSDGQICDPATGTCTDEPVACTEHSDCGAAAYCDEQSACQPNGTGGPCNGDTSCLPGESCTGGFCGCEGDQFTAEAVPPNVLIVLDKSGSMNDDNKWDDAVAAINTLLGDFGDSVRFGLVLYPEGNSCGPGAINVDVGDGTAAEIISELPAEGDGSTPIGDTLDGLLNYPGLEDPTRENYILLLTDGEERCDGNGQQAAANLLAESPSVKTFVVGFGSGVDADELNAIAEAGGTALPGATKYYQADDAASLAMAFSDIGGEVLSCTYELGGTPPGADDLYIYFDGVAVPRDTSHTDGWDYDEATNQVTFYGPACDSLRTGAVADLVIVHGCPIDIE